MFYQYQIHSLENFIMMLKYYFLNIETCGEIDEQTDFSNALSPSNVGLEISHWPKDDLFQTAGQFFVTNRLAAMLHSANLTGLILTKLQRINPGFNFVNRYPGYIPDIYLHLKASSFSTNTDFGIWHQTYLVVSENALIFLRENRVVFAESDLIDIDMDEYFKSDRVLFWMPESSVKEHLREIIKTK